MTTAILFSHQSDVNHLRLRTLSQLEKILLELESKGLFTSRMTASYRHCTLRKTFETHSFPLKSS